MRAGTYPASLHSKLDRQGKGDEQDADCIHRGDVAVIVLVSIGARREKGLRCTRRRRRCRQRYVTVAVGESN